MSAEVWKPAVGLEGRYEVSSHGAVRRVGALKNRKPRTGNKGYLTLRFGGPGGAVIEHCVHRMVGEAFLGPLPTGLMTRHLDGNRYNNRLENLQYGTNRENQLDSVRHGTCWPALVTACPQGHPYDQINTYRTPAGKRDCRTCRREASRRFRARQACAA